MSAKQAKPVTNAPRREVDWLEALRAYIALSTSMHLLWECLQLPLYTLWKDGTWQTIAFAMLHCTAGDVMIAALALLAALLLFGHRQWPVAHFGRVSICCVVIGLVYTIYSEWLNVVVRMSWAYSGLMPQLPYIGTGLSPLLQWLVIPAASFAIVANSVRRACDHVQPSTAPITD